VRASSIDRYIYVSVVRSLEFLVLYIACTWPEYYVLIGNAGIEVRASGLSSALYIDLADLHIMSLTS
jgi:hypothetical protein